MTIAFKEIGQGQAFAHMARRINVALVVFLLFYLVIGLLQPNYLEPTGAMNFLRRAAPLAILAGQIFVLISGGFDLSGGSLVTLTVVGASMLTANDPGNTWRAIAVLYAIGLLVGLTNGAVVAYQTALIAECPPDTKVQPDCPLPMGRLVDERGIEPHGKPAVCMPSF
jgi:ribose/xylose/arabinose/galactoside ABC-type transport system permease subunit